MGKVVASGTLTNLSIASPAIELEEKYTGTFGLLLSGTFDGGDIITLGLLDPISGFNREWGFYSYAGGFLKPNWSVPGFYQLENFIDQFKLKIQNQGASANVDYYLFLKGRP